eukprot:442632-Pyramimonas_sp.AAC.1
MILYHAWFLVVKSGVNIVGEAEDVHEDGLCVLLHLTGATAGSVIVTVLPAFPCYYCIMP